MQEISLNWLLNTRHLYFFFLGAGTFFFILFWQAMIKHIFRQQLISRNISKRYITQNTSKKWCTSKKRVDKEENEREGSVLNINCKSSYIENSSLSSIFYYTRKAWKMDYNQRITKISNTTSKGTKSRTRSSDFNRQD